MPHRFELHDAVILEVDRPDDGLLKGAMGVVLERVEPDSVIVQFFDANLVSMDVAALPEGVLRPENNDERSARINLKRQNKPRRPELN